MTVTLVVYTINMITIVIDDSRGFNYNRSSVTRVVPQFGASLLRGIFRITIFLDVIVQATGFLLGSTYFGRKTFNRLTLGRQ